ncbi:TPA: hypothetical protein DCQ44_03645 [Candidatus Taylorbacteria bacterium]|nr:hypothetical protein [Candidatus Taylorbacteria bacterium]
MKLAIKAGLKRAFNKNRVLWREPSFVLSVIIGIVSLCLAFVANYFAGSFASRSVSSSVTDIILDNTRVWNVTFLFIEGPLIFWGFIAVLLVAEPKRIPFTLKSLALFTVIRSVFITLTHLAPFATRLVLPTDNLLDMFSFGGDLFFSAHTGAPFLMALVLWDHKYIRLICLISSLVFGLVVLLGHLHYSIDVFAAFFITYTIYHMAVYFFKKDFDLLKAYPNIKVL